MVRKFRGIGCNITGYDKRWPKWAVIGLSYFPMLSVLLTLLL
ncbi:hypothetical protein [Ferviditalea candida]|uniref:Uncharacterized protein n=1 Tax=Ferviditalea candida TaxID=3108399 RepID=A0ABU5ZJ54_9BACL|nr:hypothetical protein [Paenibacillaceae bacterium T2]